MAHFFHIMNDRTKEQAGFAGLAGGIIYEQFESHDLNAGVSGSGEERVFSKQFVENALINILASSQIRNYPDPTRADELRKFLVEVVGLSNDADTFTATFL